MLVFPKPREVSGVQLAAELAAAGYASPHVVADRDSLRVHGHSAAGEPLDERSRVKVQGVLDAHVPNPLWAATPEDANAQVLAAQVTSALDQLRTFVTASKPNTAAAQASAAYDGARLCARVCVGLVRLHLRRLDATD